eukprot:TRINITY_DN15852_c0_g2_i1.p1 TRINITY_DN15852_c0_g2~~TRINITY_DN15852_c0_g2_i1.p1  ORF type:complete len:142 (+),score=18.11 TRINITY_DN15852_c0_g2_i1:362-787(+)
MKPGAYHIFQPSSDSQQQAALFCNTVKSYNTNQIPPILDIEITGGLETSQLQKNIFIWLNYVNSTLGIKPIIYTNEIFATSYLNETFGNYDLYLAISANANVNIPNIWRNAGKGWKIMQNSSSGQVPGINGQVKLDFMNIF